ncbi:hypothetical protein HETIRDRAFT_120455 [Heterobasidion irregulare TC 32-1]|uniref:CCHC-type domain-containing protein n=1 Tax=Heterobasidion irregulare (strain TC 32-1) TaxID=747525 RepID=W4JNB3_HETIT|nr:uncharacterized protein HETIRDRAFT_120455 [Heterobasidion irregulare TC 32-1]ETW75033.1 hypothetical protein HETIRDRAFT_120455 [Heterobasidion irregulare TC 32-1]
MLTNPRNPESKGPAIAKPTPFDGNRKRTEQFLHEIDLMILARKYDFPGEFAKIAYALSYMKGGSAELSGVDLETKKTHFLRGLKWELARGIYQDPAKQDTWEELVAKAKRHETMRIEEMRARDLRQGKYQVFTPSNYYSNIAPPRQERESQYVPMDVDAAEMEADAIRTRFKKLTPGERSQLAKEGKCFYCKKPGHMARGCPSRPKQRFPPPSRGRFQPKRRMMRAMEEEEGGDEEDQEEGKQRVAYIQQMMMGLSMDEIEEVRAFSESKNF